MRHDRACIFRGKRREHPRRHFDGVAGKVHLQSVMGVGITHVNVAIFRRDDDVQWRRRDAETLALIREPCVPIRLLFVTRTVGVDRVAVAWL